MLQEEARAFFPLPLLAFIRRKRAQFHTAREAARIKKPQPETVGVGLHKLPPLSLERTSQRWVGAGLLARGIFLLSAPSQGQHPSVASADFVPLTVAGQRWVCTIFPGHRLTL